MAYPDDPYAPMPVTPWASWDETPWASYGQPTPVAPLQPGIGMPSDLLTSSMPPQQEIEMPAMDVSRSPDPYIGFPANPDQAPPPPLPPPPQEFGPPTLVPDMPADPSLPAMQPGLGIPAHLLTEAAQGQFAADQMPPEPQGDIEFAPDQLTEQDRQQSLNEMSGPDFAEFAATQAEAAKVAAAGSLLKAEHARAKDAEDDYKVYVEARTVARENRAKVEADAAVLANEQPQTWMESRSGFQKVAAFLAAIVGGLVQGRTGSARNSGMDMINAQIEQYAQEQTAIRANKRAAIGDRRASAQEAEQDVESDFRAEAAYRASAWEHTIRQLDAEAQNYDQAGTSAIRIAGARRDAVSQQQAALAAYEEREIKRMEAAGKSQLEVAKFIQKQEDDRLQRIEDERNNRAQNKAAQTSAGASWLNATTSAKKTEAEIKALELENKVETTAELQRLYPNAPKEAFAIGPTSLKKFEKHLSTFGKASDVGKDESEATIKAAQARLEGTGPGGSPYTIGDQAGNALLAKDGKTPLEIKDSTKLTAITNVRDAAINIRKAADLYKIMRTKYGGASEALGSDEYQEYKSLVAGIDFETYKLFGLGAPSAGDQQMAADIRGGKDPTSFLHDSSGGFEAYAKNAESKLNTMVVGAGGAPVKLKTSEAAQSYERNITQNIDTWEPEALKNPDASLEAKKEAAQAALSSVDALSGQADPDLLRIIAGQNARRVAEGLVDPVDGARVQKQLRAAMAKKLPKGMGNNTIANEIRSRALAAGLSDEAYLDRELGIGVAE